MRGNVESLGSAIWLKHLSPSLMHKKHQFIFSLTLWKKQAITQSTPAPLSTNYNVRVEAAVSFEWGHEKRYDELKKHQIFGLWNGVLHNVHSFSLNVSHSISLCFTPFGPYVCLVLFPLSMDAFHFNYRLRLPIFTRTKTSKKFITTFVTVCA